MIYRENRSHYYDFELDIGFISNKFHLHPQQEQWLVLQTMNGLFSFAKEHIIDSGIRLEAEQIIVIHKSKKKVDDLQNFFNELISSGKLAEFALKHYLKTNDFDSFQNDLKRFYDHYKLDKEILPKEETGKKKIKI